MEEDSRSCKGIIIIDDDVSRQRESNSSCSGDSTKRAFEKPYWIEKPLVDQIVSMLELEETLTDHQPANSLESAKKYRKTAKFFVEASLYHKALPHCLKSLEILTSLKKSKGCQEKDDDSLLLDTRITRILLSIIYAGLEEYHKSRQQTFLSTYMPCSSLTSSSCELVLVEIDFIRLQILSRGDYDLGLRILETSVKQRSDSCRFLIYLEKAQIFIALKKYEDSKICLAMCFEILEKLESVASSSIEFVTTSYMKIARVCEKMDKLKNDVTSSMLERSISKLEKLGGQYSTDCRWDLAFLIGKLKGRTGMESEAIGYLLKAEDSFKVNFGSQHSGLGKIYKHLGKAFSKLGDYRMAIHMLKLAKANFDVSLGPNHRKSIKVRGNLSTAYRAIKSYRDAIQLLEEVIVALEKQGPNVQAKLGEAQQRLEELLKEA